MDGFSKFKNWQTAKNQENPLHINLNNVNAFAHALEQIVFFGKLAVSQKLEEISKCCQKDFLLV